MQFPVRDRNDVLVLRKNDFGIKQVKYLYALEDFVLGFATKESVRRFVDQRKDKVTEIMLKETFRRNLCDELHGFTGDEFHVSFAEFCRSAGLPDLLQPGRSAKPAEKFQMYLMVLCYLREVFDVRPPMRVEE